MLALANSYDNVAATLLQHPDINIDVKSDQGTTPLMLACKNGAVRSTGLLIAKGSFGINQQDARGYTALMHATENRHQELVGCLLRLPNINVDLKEQFGRTARQLQDQYRFMPPTSSHSTGSPRPVLPYNPRAASADSMRSLPYTPSLYSLVAESAQAPRSQNS
ncbi:ankyrin repeat-containing domain protein [Coprinopsis sp. MPI-PUGE-AT-0042]|nr:ankyrin repeat-containing domain protein [Coprinopsis sp. MPI-PUGE-AT-0042]